MLRRLAKRGAGRLILSTLRKTFRRIVWIGDMPTLPAGVPVVLYANHHSFFDGYLLWFLAEKVLARQPILWMEEWKNAPLFGPLGALPFSSTDSDERMRTLRESIRRMNANPNTLLILFPEGEMGLPAAGLQPFKTDFNRLSSIFPSNTVYWPVAMRLTWWGEDSPTVLMTAGEPTDVVPNHAFDGLQNLLELLDNARPSQLESGEAQTLMDGSKSADERWNLSFLAPFFRRIT